MEQVIEITEQTLNCLLDCLVSNTPFQIMTKEYKIILINNREQPVTYAKLLERLEQRREYVKSH